MGRTTRRVALGAAGGILAACAQPPQAQPPETRAAPVMFAEPAPAPAPPAAAAPAPAPPVEQPAPPPRPSVIDLGVQGIAQPIWSAGGERVLFYDQPQPGLGGTWSIEPGAGQVERERPQWGYYVAQGTLLATPRPTQRDTYVLHLPSGREWALPTANSTLFSWDGTMVTYSAAAQPAPGVPGPGPGTFQTTTLVVSWADGQEARRVPLPISASLVAWLPARDGSPNGRILLTGKRNRTDGTAFFVLDPNTRALADFGRSRRLIGANPSPDGQWVAWMAMWNDDPAQNGFFVARTDGSDRRRIEQLGSYRWTADGRLIVIPVRASSADSHEVWQVDPSTGQAQRLTDPAETPFRISNYDWDLTPDGTQLVFVSADSRRLSMVSLPNGMEPSLAPLPALPALPSTSAVGGPGKPYRLPFTAPLGSPWYVAQWYGITTTGYRARNSAYSQGQGIHFGVDFPNPLGTPVVAVAPGRVIAVDGDYGSPPHNVVIQLTDGNVAMYGHLVEPSRHVQVGQLVEPGQVVGNTGDSSAPYDGNGNPHIHLEIRKQGRAIATNPVPYFDVNWDDMGLGYPGPRFEKNLDDPRRYQFPDDQPDIRFGGAIISNFARPWPP